MITLKSQEMVPQYDICPECKTEFDAWVSERKKMGKGNEKKEESPTNKDQKDVKGDAC